MIAYRTMSAGALMILARLSTRLLDLASIVFYARLLSPADFGIIAIASSIVAIVEATSEIPLNQVLLRLPSAETDHYDTAFTLGIIRCLFLYLVLVTVSWPLASWYQDPRLRALILVLGLGAMARGSLNPRLAESQRRLSFWRDMVIEIAGKLISTVFGLTTAYLTADYWSVGLATTLSPIMMLLGSYFLMPYRPHFGLKHFRVFGNFLGWFSVAQLISTANWQLERIIVGRLVPTNRFGLFTTSSDLSQIPLLAFLAPIIRPLLTAFQNISDDRERLARSYRNASYGIVMISVPLLVGESVLAEPIIRTILGEKWIDAIPLLRWLPLSIIPGLPTFASLALVSALGCPRELVSRNIVEICIKFSSLFVFYSYFGLIGVALARMASEAVAAIFYMHVIRRLIGISVLGQVFFAWPCFLSSILMGLVTYIAYKHSGFIFKSSSLLELLTCTTIGFLVYVCSLSGIWYLRGCPDGTEKILYRAFAALSQRALARQSSPARG